MTNYTQDYGYFAQKASGFAAGLLVGGLLGAGIMLLLAPKSGKRMRAAIQQKSIELRDQTSDVMEDMIAQAGMKARQTRSSVRKQVKELEQTRKDMLNDQKKRLNTLVEAGKNAVKGAEFPIGARR